MGRHLIRLLCGLTAILFLLSGCVHYQKRPEKTPETTVVTTAAQTTEAQTTEGQTPASTDESGFPNAPEQDATKRY